MYPFDDQEKNFYTIDYQDESNKSANFDPLATPHNSDTIPKLKRFDVNGNFIEEQQDDVYNPFYQSSVKPTKTESELAPMVEGSEYADDYGWWKKESGYRAWLNEQGFDPDKLDSFSGNKMYTDYIAWKAQNPDGFMKFGSDVMGAVGGAIQGVSNVLGKIPGMKAIGKPLGSILQFVGNIVDLPRNVLAGVFTAFTGGGDIGDAAENFWQAAKFSVGSIVGNEGTEEGQGRYFSWMDGQLMSMVNKAKQGMSDSEYKNYIDSDSFRQTKRAWQAGGMLLDLVVDPAWFLGAFGAKSLKAAKGINANREIMGVIVDSMKNIKAGGLAKYAEAQDGFIAMTEAVNAFTKQSKKWLGFVREDKSFLKTLGLETFDFEKAGLVDSFTAVSDKFANLSKTQLKPFEYAFRAKIPFTGLDVKIGPAMPKMEGLAERIIGKMSGQPNATLSEAARYAERASTRINVFSDVNRAIYEGEKTFSNAIDALLKDADPVKRLAAEEILRSPDPYNDLLSAILESNTSNPMFSFLDVPGASDAKKRSLFAVNESLFNTLISQPAIQTMKKEMDELFLSSYTRLQKSMNYNLQVSRILGLTDELAKTVGLDEKTIQELSVKGNKKTRKTSLKFKEAADKLEFEGNAMLRYGPKEGKSFFEKANQVENMYPKYFPRMLTDEASKYLDALKLKTGEQATVGMGQVIADPMRHVYTAVDFGNEILSDLVFDMEGGKAFRKLLAESPNKATLEMHKGLQNLYVNDRSTFDKLIGYSNILDEKGVPIKLNDLDMAKYGTRDIKPLISQGSISLLNEYSRKGMLVEGFSGSMYKGGFEPIYQKILADQKMIERLESVNMVLMEGQKGGWLKKVNGEQDLLNYDSTWKYQKEGIFKNFIVKDFLEKPLQAAVGGMMNVAQHLDDTSAWWLKGGKQLLSGFAGWWKVNVYIKNPAAQPRNFVTNMIMMWGAGVSPTAIFGKEAADGRKVWKYYRAAEKYQESLMSGTKSAALKATRDQLGQQTVTLMGNKISIFEATEIAMRKNIIGSGMIQSVSDELHAIDEAHEYDKFRKMAAERDKSFVRKYNPLLYFLGKNDIYAQTGKHVGSMFENAYARLPMFFHMTEKKGLSIGEAARAVNETLVDYGRLGKTEDAIRKYLIPFYCVPDNTEILTKNGWKFYNEISIGDSVLTYNLGIDKSEWEPIRDIAIFDYEGDLLEIGHSYHRFSFTKDHRVPVVKDRSWFRRIVRAYELKNGDRIPLASEVDIPKSSILTTRDAVLLSWIVTDGYFRWRKNSFESMIYQSPGKYASKIRTLFGTYISSESIHPDTGVICFRIKAEFTKRITKYFKSKNDLPQIVTRLNREALEGMFEAMMDAEGCRNNSNSKYTREMGDSFNQKLGPVMDAFQIICLLLGKSFQIAYSEKYDRAAGYVKKSRYLFYHKKHSKTIPYTGKIWCPKTDNSTWYMRQNGKVMITGNTWQSRMVPVMLQKIVEQPAFFSKITQLKNNAYNILEMDKNFAPMGEQVMEGIPGLSMAPSNLLKFVQGKPLNEIRTQYFSGEGWLPQAVINLFEPTTLKNLISPDRFEEWAPIDQAVKIGKGAMETVISSANPIPKLMLESLTGYSFQFKRMMQAYPDQTVSFVGQHWTPKHANLLRTVFGTLREVDDIVNIFDKNAITGQPKFTVYDVLWKNLIGYRPYQRDEIREINGALGKMKQVYQSNLMDAKKMVYDAPEQQRHAKNALMAYHAIKAMKWYKEFAIETRDKEMAMRGIRDDIAALDLKMENWNLNKTQRAKYETKKVDLYSRLESFLADQKEF